MATAAAVADHAAAAAAAYFAEADEEEATLAPVEEVESREEEVGWEGRRNVGMSNSATTATRDSTQQLGKQETHKRLTLLFSH
uniref:Uncharacterized protein n=1 Tax=Oryza barthii TaxID=65489 RepID=A0A0D3GMH8_9ORYZ